MYVNEIAPDRPAEPKRSVMQNVGTLDRIIRLVLGALLIIAPFVTGWPLFASAIAVWGSVVVGAALIATAVFSFCPIYAALGLRTRPRS